MSQHFYISKRSHLIPCLTLIITFVIIDSIFDTFVIDLNNASFIENFIFMDTTKFWMRVFVIGIIIFSFFYTNKLYKMAHTSLSDIHTLLERDSDGFILLNDKLEIKLASKKAYQLFNCNSRPELISRILKFVNHNKCKIKNELFDIIKSRKPDKLYYTYKSFTLELICYPTDSGISVFLRKNRNNQSEDYIEKLKYSDPLTGLINRESLLDNLKRCIKTSPSCDSIVGGLLINISRFKAINDSFGHQQGDEILKTAAKYIKLSVREEDIVSRLGGDKFFVSLVNAQSKESIETVAKRIMDHFREPLSINNIDVFVSINMGISMFPLDANDESEMLSNSEIALNHAKESKSTACRFYIDNKKTREKCNHAETNLRKAIDEEQFVIYYQPQIDTVSNTLIGVEGLLRWKHPEKGLVPPLEFIPTLEESGLIADTEKWSVNKMCMDAIELQALTTSPIQVGINISGLHFREKSFLPMLKSAIAHSKVSSKNLNMEITESILLGNNQEIIRKLEEIHKLGIRLSLDDFGTGYSSLNYIKNYPIDVIKIDRSFIKDIETDPKASAIVKTIINMADHLELDLIAEGVETESQLHYLQDYGCHHIQGFFIGKPMPIDELRNWIQNSNLNNVNHHLKVVNK